MTTTSTRTPAPAGGADQRSGSGPGLGATIRDRLQQFLAFASLIVIFLFFSAMSENFLNSANITAILFSTVVIGTLALGTTFVIITGGIDLSVGSLMAIAGALAPLIFLGHLCPLPSAGVAPSLTTTIENVRPLA